MNAPAPIELGSAVRVPVVAPWPRHLAALGLVALGLLALFHADARDIARIWWTASTYEHCLFIPPLVGWLVWQRVPELARLTPTPSVPALGLVALGGLGWLLGDAAGVAIARHAGLVLMLQGAAIACLGTTVARALAFPLFYLCFLVPAGEELIAPMQTLTARMCLGLLHAAGVPASLDGVFLTVPGGYFEVAAACSGVKFLVAMIAYGALVANVGFRSWPRRIAFMAACVAAPVLANGVRAFGTIYVAHLTGDVGFAGSFDHVVYGWIFFALVMALVIGGAWRFFDRGVHDPWFDPRALQPVLPPPASPARLAGVALAALLIAVAPIARARAVQAAGGVAPSLALPDVPGWTRARIDGVPWRPRFDRVDREVIGRYRDAAGRRVDLAIDVYASQSEGRELVGYGQGAVDPRGAWAWMEDSPDPPGGDAFRITAPGPGGRAVVREVATFYRVGDVTTGSAPLVKLETLRARLLGGRQRAVAVIVSAEEPGARPALDAFLRALGPIDGLADRSAGPR